MRYGRMGRKLWGVGLAVIALTATLVAPVSASSTATAGPVSQDMRFTASDGVSLQTTLTGQGPLAPRPTIVEFSPYGRNSGTVKPGPGYNFLLVQIRGTGDSDGSFDALGPRSQQDVAETLGWACHQSWSNGNLALNGFSASAIIIYNSLHLPLPCVKAAVLKSGTDELYRDLLVPGGISNIVPGAGVIALIGAPAAAQSPGRAGDPLSGFDVLEGLLNSGLQGGVGHPTLDSWWAERGFRGDVNHLPILMIDGFFDVESRGAFQAFQQLRGDGAHLEVVGGHDGAPKGTDGGAADTAAWFDHYVSDVNNGIENTPKVQLWLSDGDRLADLNGDYVRYSGSDWPIPGTKWASMPLDPAKSGTSHSLNDGSLGLTTPTTKAVQSYLSIPSVPTSTDPPNTAIVGGMGLNALLGAVPVLGQGALSEPLGLTYTTKPLSQNVLAAGPASLEIPLSSTAPETGIWGVISDVSPDGVSHPLGAGRLLSSFPDIDAAKSLHDTAGNVVEPYGVYDHKSPATIGQTRLYHVEFWPIGNRFKQGDRIRLEIVGASAASLPTVPALNSVSVGAGTGARLLFPVLPGSDLGQALGTIELPPQRAQAPTRVAATRPSVLAYTGADDAGALLVAAMAFVVAAAALALRRRAHPASQRPKDMP